MNEDKIQKFFSALISKTKNNELQWTRCSNTDFNFPRFVNAELSFLCAYNRGDIALYCDKIGTLSCWITPDENLSEQQVGEPDDPSLLRLYNIVHSRFPSVESFMDNIINN